jgi:hypothetical protein
LRNSDAVLRKLREDCRGLDMEAKLSLVGNAQAMLAWMRVQELEKEVTALKARLAEVEPT